jgi:hypothetical protein
MENKMIPFPLEDSPYNTRLKIKDTQFLTVFAAHAIQVLAKTGRSSMVIWEGKPPALPYKTDTWDLLEITNELSLPIETQRRINILRNNNIPIKQILIAHEHQSEEQMLLEAARRDERRKGVERVTSNLLRGLAWVTAAVAIGVAVVAVLPMILTIVGVIAGLLLVGSVVVYDPAVVVVLDDGFDSWLLASYWYE